MTEPPESPTPAPATAPVPVSPTTEEIARVERTTRLAKALRDNLRRRKRVQPTRDKPGN